MASSEASTSAAAVTNVETQATIFKRLHPHAYLASFLDAEPSVREDGRSSFDFRSVDIVTGSISTALGSCTVRLGQTTIVAGVTAEIGRIESQTYDPEKRKDRGWIVPSLDLSPICSPRFKSGPPSEEAQVLTSRIINLLDSSNPVDLTTLSIQEGEAAWCLYIDLVCLSYDGGVLDACMLAIAGALSDTTIPAARWDPEEMTVVCSAKATDRQRLHIRNVPLVSSFDIYKTHLLSDCSAFESALASSHIAICLSTTMDERTAAPTLSHLYQAGRCACVHRTPKSEVQSLKQDSNSSSSGLKDLQSLLASGKALPEGHIALDDERTLELSFLRAKRRYAYLRTLLQDALRRS